jgi:dephospho-CoA kinase
VKIIGLTGGIGSGKSTAAAILGELGATVIDADRVGHEVYLPGTAWWGQVVAAFGKDIVAQDGTIDRKRLGGIVFADRSRLVELNGIVHPLIADTVRHRIAEHVRTTPRTPIVVEAAVLIEANWQTLVDEVWLVVASAEAVVARLGSQRGLSREAIEARVRSQLSEADRRKHAAVVIDNSGTLEDLRAQLSRLWAERVVNKHG